MEREFRSIASIYQKLRGPKPENLHMWVNCVIEYANLKPADKIIDLGCGIGAFSLAFAARGLEVYAIDISEDMLKVAKESDDNRLLNQSL